MHVQDGLISPADVIGPEEVQIAVDALKQLAQFASDERNQLQAAETLLRYGVKDPYGYSAPQDPGEAA